MVKIDNWEKTGTNLIPEVYKLNESASELLYIPEGYANCIKAGRDDSILLVYSGKTLEDAMGDSWRYDKDLWVDWSHH